MQIVIDIPEDIYKVISEDEYGVHQGRIYEIIRNGTPLPKGHGRLIDVNTLEFRNVTVSYGYDWECGETTYAEEAVVREDDIWNAPTIIEAESEEKK